MDNSLDAQAQSIFSLAKLQYDLTDDLSFEDLQKDFAADRDLNFRAWCVRKKKGKRRRVGWG
jgi:hypothetical protein